MKRHALLLLLMLVLAPALADSLGDAAAAMDAGDYGRAEMLLRPLSRDGNMDAQYLLGGLYSTGGKGVAANADEAVKWLSRAAEQGHLEAANTLGKIHISGLGVPINETEAKKWFAVAEKIAAASNKSTDCQ